MADETEKKTTKASEAKAAEAKAEPVDPARAQARKGDEQTASGGQAGGSGVTAKEARKDSGPASSGSDSEGLTFGPDDRLPIEDEWEKAGVDPRLDNRTGRDRPKLEEWPAKPQQVPGPEVGDDFSEHRPAEGEKFLEARDGGERKGMHSAGPHGLGDDDNATVNEDLYGKDSNAKD